MPDPVSPVDHRPPLPPPNPLLGQTVDGNPARSLVDRTPLDPAQIADPTREPYATRLWREVERLRAEKVRGDDATRDCIRDLRSEVERLRAELADHHCDCLAGKIAGVRADRDRLAARLQAVEALCDQFWGRDSETDDMIEDFRAALAVPAATEDGDVQ